MSPDSIDATVTIPTKNRRDDLRRCLRAVFAQTARLEVIVTDDGSTDGTSDMVRDEFPQVTLRREESSRGVIVQRNRMIGIATSPIVFCLDDDAEFSSPDIVRQTLDEFEDPRIGIITIPLLDMNTRQLWMPPIPDDGRVHLIDGYCGGSCAIRRDMFLRVGGMREISAHQEEERDFSIRALDQGYVVRAGRADVMHHYESPVRNVKRNTVSKSMARTLFVFNNVPHPYMIPNLLVTSVNLIRFGLKRGHALWTMQGIFKGLMVILQSGLRTRRAVSRSTFRLTRLLSKSGGRMTLDEVAAFLRPIEPNQPANVRASG